MCQCHGGGGGDTLSTTAPQCPFVIRQLNSSTFMVREHDAFGEYPQIYVKRVTQATAMGDQRTVILINDTGAGTTAPRQDSEHGGEWNIKSFIDHNFNVDGDTPYLVLLSHCHFDHIMGLKHILGQGGYGTPHSSAKLAQTTILASSAAQTFTTPYERLMETSLCAEFGVAAPEYQPSMWAGDREHVAYEHPKGGTIQLPVITLHTPGHTPDSLSWYDMEERVLYVGDTCYEDESDDTRTAPWGNERPAPIVFPSEGDLHAWWESLRKLTAFVKERNKEDGRRVTLAAGHVTASIDAEECLASVMEFASKMLRDEADFKEWFPIRGEAFGLWTDDTKRKPSVRGFRLAAPMRLVEKAREVIPKA